MNVEALATLSAISGRLSGLSEREKVRVIESLKRISLRRNVRAADDQESVEKARASLAYFTKLVWSLIEPGTPIKWNWHLDVECERLEAVTRGEVTRLLVNVPPATTKSILFSVAWPCWEWFSNPELRYLKASYGEHLSLRDNLRVRLIVQSEWYQKNSMVRLAGDQNAKQLFKTTAGGWMFATSVGGAATGDHPDRIIIDDALTAEQARSKADREFVNSWFDSTITTRGVTRNAAIIVIMQRLHGEDLSGHLLDKGGWEHLRLPMRYEAKPVESGGRMFYPDPLDQRTVEGELLWPTLFDEEKVKKLEIALGEEYNVAGQLQQRPSPAGGGLFKREWFGIIEKLPEGKRRSVRGWDTAATAGGGNYTVGVKITQIGPTFYVEDVVRGQWGPADVDKIMLETARADGRECTVAEEKEGGSSGKAVVEARARAMVGFDYVPVQITGDKTVRASPYRSQAQSGNVKLLRGLWNAQYLSEVTAFPSAKQDDQVDGSSSAFNELAKTRVVKQVEVSWG